VDVENRDFPSIPSPPGGPGPAGAEPPPSLLERFVRLFTSPVRAWTPPLGRSVWIAALILLAAGQFAQGWLLRDLVREQMLDNIRQSEQMSEAQKDEILGRMEEGYASSGRYLQQILMGVVGSLLVAYLIPAGLYLFGLNFGLGARARFEEVFAVTTFSALVLLVRDLIRIPLMLSRETLYVFVSPAALVDPSNRALVWGLDRLDLFGLYRLLLLALGFAAITRMRATRAAIPVVAVWLLVGLLGIAFMRSPLGRMFG